MDEFPMVVLSDLLFVFALCGSLLVPWQVALEVALSSKVGRSRVPSGGGIEDPAVVVDGRSGTRTVSFVLQPSLSLHGCRTPPAAGSASPLESGFTWT